MRWLALGDSYTVGEGVPTEASWPYQLRQRLQTSGWFFEHPEIIAQTGWTTSDLLVALEATEMDGSYDLVSLLIGVNNQYRGWPVATYRSEFATLLQKAVGYANHNPERVLVVAIPNWGVTPHAHDRDRRRVHDEIEQYNAISRAGAARLGTAYVDVFSPSLEAAHNPALLAADNLHPSASQYSLWVDAMLPVVKSILTS